MRLTKIKLAGFKSFVDPTTFQLPSNLVGIVGPNGCGKSNIIDAVRWVMGESSVRTLRGESMADVIFNGSSTRKSVGQASIELVFDNGQAKLQGPWAQYAEISVKRILNRDGQSNYYLNGARCRRRDVTGLFLGTGLGPRSYAIIEQGMISRVIESKPEELRVFLEEAAGISKYKERRRETEMRIRHTRENLGRLSDLREELAKQLEHLQRQARNAERYKQHRAEERRLKAELLSLRWRTLDLEVNDQERLIRESETALESTVAEQRSLEASLEQGRQRQHAQNDAFNEVQSRFYELGAEITRLEQGLEHRRQLRRQQGEELTRVEQSLARLEQEIEQDREQSAELEQALTRRAKPELEAARLAEQEANKRLQTAESAQQDWQAEWEEFSRRDSEVQRAVEVERTHIDYLDRQLLRQQRQVERLRLERDGLAEDALRAELEELRTEERENREQLTVRQKFLAEVQTHIESLTERRDRLLQTLDTIRHALQAGRGRLASLEALQEAALGRHNAVLDEWLQQQQLDRLPRLAEELEVESGWERAVETVLDTYLQAICIEDLTLAAPALSRLEQGRVSFLEKTVPAIANVGSNALASKVRSSWSLGGLLKGVKIVDDLVTAVDQRNILADGESLVTPEGVWLGRDWLKLNRPGAEDAGVLVREREIRKLTAALTADSAALTHNEASLTQSLSELAQLDQQYASEQEKQTADDREQIRVQGRLAALDARLEQLRERRAAIDAELVDLIAQAEQGAEELAQARLRLEQALQDLEHASFERERLVAQRDELRAGLDECRRCAAAARETTQQHTLTTEALNQQQRSNAQALARLQDQHERLAERRAQLQITMIPEDECETLKQLETLLETRLQVEGERDDARRALEVHDAELGVLESRRNQVQVQLQKQREVLEAHRLACSETRVQRQNLVDQLQELEADPKDLLAQLPAQVEEAIWLEQLDAVAKRIQRLGAINLAAIDEFAQLAERKRYLDTQNDDLVDALTTLENAIAKIDRETRGRFRDTFSRVNDDLQGLFPRLFGGGQAYLELIGTDVLDAGVAIMAQPPGKRVGNIHLLSGGEKALTAVALVFAIFQLNPAPFCMLDEVDAPLDDYNVGRFGDLVREMSGQVQFIFITHNKGTMAIAQHLTGVTMQEPGVSRLVAVDIDEAVRLAVV